MIKETTILHTLSPNLNLELPPEHVEWSKFNPGDNTSVMRRSHVEAKELLRLEDRRHLSSSRQSWNPNVQVLDLTAVDSELKGFSGGFESGGYGYFVPFRNTRHSDENWGCSGKVARVDLAKFSQVQVLDLTDTDPDLKGFNGGFASGDYGYFVPYRNGLHPNFYFGKVARVDLATFSQVQVLDLTTTDADLMGFQGGFASGGYGYFVPYCNGLEPDFYSGKVARVDLKSFSQVQVLDLTDTDPDLKGFLGGFASGDYGYFVPYYNGDWFGKVAR